MDNLVLIFVATVVIILFLGIVLWIKCKKQTKKITQESFSALKAETGENPVETTEEPEEQNEESETENLINHEARPVEKKTVSFKDFDVMAIGKTNSSAYGTIETYNKYDPKYNNVFDHTF